jgi:hypothetical protein
LTYYKRDFFFRSGSWREQHIDSLLYFSQKDPNHSLVLGHSDVSTNRRHLIIARFLGYSKIWGTNLFPCKNFSSPIPLGLVNESSDSDFHAIAGNPQSLKSAFDHFATELQYNGLIYANFTTSNNHSVRNQLLMRIKDSNRVIITEQDFSPRGRMNYLKDLTRYSFVLCPEGNGFDTHRLWETLYMGGLPVVKSNPFIDPLVERLPVVIIHSWEEVLNEKFMEQKWGEAKIKQNSIHELSMSFWEKKLIQ